MKLPQRPYPPYEHQYQEFVERKYIYQCKESLREDDEEWDWDEDEDEEPEETIPIDQVDLGWLISQLPDGINPAQIKIEFGYRASSMAYEYHYVRFYYEVTVPAKPEEYEAAKAAYQQALEQYEKDVVTYEEWKAQKEIDDAEATLNRLKKARKKFGVDRQ